jgi:hypothetical protein
MATKMNHAEDPKDRFLSELIRAEEPLPVPADLLENVMHWIEAVPSRPAVRSYIPPVWLRRGIPAVFGISFILVLIFGGKSTGPAITMPDLTHSEKVFSKTNDWLAGLLNSTPFTDLVVPDYVIWISLGGLAMVWGFVGINYLLDKRLRGL